MTDNTSDTFGNPRAAYAALCHRLTAVDLVVGGGDDAATPVKRTRKRKPTVASVIRQMKRAGVEIAGCEINPRDGTVKVITGKPSEATTPDNNDSNEWDGVLLQ